MQYYTNTYGFFDKKVYLYSMDYTVIPYPEILIYITAHS